MQNRTFNFKNMQAFVRGCIEPHIVALNTNLKAFQEHVRETFEILYQKLREKFAEHDRRFIAVGTVVIWPSTKDPSNMDKYLECNGQRVPITEEYATLRELIGDYVPNYNEQFLRGTTSAAKVNTAKGESVINHTHPATGKLASTSVSGIAAGQRYQDMKSGAFTPGSSLVAGTAAFKQHYRNIFGSTDTPVYFVTTSRSGPTIGGTEGGFLINVGVSAFGCDGGADYAEDSRVTASVSSSAVNISVSSYGGTETAPRHTYTRFLIRALP